MKRSQPIFLAVVVALLVLTACNAPRAQSQEKIRQYQFASGSEGYELALREVPRPIAGQNEVLVRVRATSLNRRDMSIINGRNPRAESINGTIPLSDGAGEIIALGQGVTRFKVGDRVAGSFFTDWVDGERTVADIQSARGAQRGGMLSEMIVTHEKSLVVIPDHLTFEEGATLPCAAVTAWSGLFKHGNLQPNDYVLLEGTGGVSSFGLLFAVAAGARPIITSSSNKKLEQAKRLGAVGTVNYRENQDWQVNVRELTNGVGVKHVLEIGGRNTVPKALEALGFNGHMALIGGLSGSGASLPVAGLQQVGGSATAIYVGSREDFEQMNHFIAKHKLHPVIDRVFSFEEAPQAYDLMQNGSFMGKIVIRH